MTPEQLAQMAVNYKPTEFEVEHETPEWKVWALIGEAYIAGWRACEAQQQGTTDAERAWMLRHAKDLL